MRCGVFLFCGLLAAPLCLPVPARAETAVSPLPSECKVLPTNGDKFCKYGNRWKLENLRTAEFAVGDEFPIYAQSMLIDLDRFDLPPVDGPWRYYWRDWVIYRVSSQTGRVLEVVGRAHRR